jgi:membrane associated rhomboid family serine protease
MERLAYANFAVIAVTCWVSYQGFRSSWFGQKYIFWPEAILAQHQYYRLVAAGFLHANGAHLLMNMMSLFFFGPLIEMRCGAGQFLVIYFAGIIGGNLLSLLVHRYHDYRACGASGGVCGIIYAYIFLFPGRSLNMLFIPLNIPSWLYAIGFLALSFYGMKAQKGDIGHDAHLGGALVGLFTAALLHPEMVRYSPRLFAAISLGTALLFVYLAKNPLFLPLQAFEFGKRGKTVRSSPPRRIEKEADAILQKISEKGGDSLTPAEKALLLEVSEKYRRRSVSRRPESGFDL